LVKAFENFYRGNHKVYLVMIGEGEQEKELKEFCNGHKLPVRFVKPVSNIYDYYNLANVVVLPSRVDPFPYVMLETGLMKKPFIGSDVDGIPELIKHKVNGILFKSEDVDELVNSLRTIFEDKLFAQKIANNLYNDVIENYTASKGIPEYVKFYNSLFR
jgi:glycosyltransferase involved in cell wall biosynthesis